jgi:dephospho-CoA kinase
VVGTLRVIGLTGGIGSGKSTVARLFAERGVPIVDADELAREATQPGAPALTEIAAAWPGVVGPDGVLDRRRLAAAVFGDATARARLEAILHPRIGALSNARFAALASQGHTLALYEAALLVETGRYQEFDGLIVVDAPDAARVARVVARDGVSEADVRARIAAQLPMEDKRRVATHVIENDGDMDALRRQVEDVAADLTRH